MGRQKEFKFTEGYIQDSLRNNFLSPSTKKYELFNLFVYGWESDYIAITRSNYIYECEIKISRSDFFNDFKNKQDKHLILESKSNSSFPNYFYYVVPENLISIDEVPSYAGLIYASPRHSTISIVKEAPKLLNQPSDLSQLNLIDKFYFAYQNWRDKYAQSDISELKSHIKHLEKDIQYYDDELSLLNSEIEDLKKRK